MVDRVLSDTQINEFAERGYIVVPQVVPGNILDKAAQRIDKVDHASHRNEFLQDTWLDYEPIRSQPATA
jgi:hypothetical protein